MSAKSQGPLLFLILATALQGHDCNLYLDEVTLTAGLNAPAFGPADSTRATNIGSSSWSRGSVSQTSPFLELCNEESLYFSWPHVYPLG